MSRKMCIKQNMRLLNGSMGLLTAVVVPKLIEKVKQKKKD